MPHSPVPVTVSSKELRKLYKRFKRLDRRGDGVLCQADLLAIPEFAMHPLSARVVAAFDEQRQDRITFQQFVKTLSAFSGRAPLEAKLACTFGCLGGWR